MDTALHGSLAEWLEDAAQVMTRRPSLRRSLHQGAAG